jgi:PhnB protein
MAKLYPYIFSEDARKQAEFYAQALNGEIVNVLTFAEAPNMPEELKDKVMHLVLQAAGITFFMADAVEDVERGTALDLTLEFSTEEEARNAFTKLSEGGKVIMPFEKAFWGAMFGRVEDKYGIRWQIVTEHE